MKLTNQRKAYLGIFGVALAGLVVDRIIGYDTGPQSASATDFLVSADERAVLAQQILQTADRTLDRSLAGAAPNEPAKTNVVSVAAQIQSLSEAGAAGNPGLASSDEDAFALPSELAKIVAAGKPAKADADGASSPSPARSPGGLILTSTFVPSDPDNAVHERAVAIINGRTLSVGAVVGVGNETWTLVSIGDRWAVLANALGQETTLRISETAVNARE